MLLLLDCSPYRPSNTTVGCYDTSLLQLCDVTHRYNGHEEYSSSKRAPYLTLMGSKVLRISAGKRYGDSTVLCLVSIVNANICAENGWLHLLKTGVIADDNFAYYVDSAPRYIVVRWND